MLTNVNARKRPKCTRCGNLMAGHRRRDGIIHCPSSSLSPHPQDRIWADDPRDLEIEDSLPSPPASPHPDPFTAADGFQVPEGDRWHWRNPNWVSPSPPRRRKSRSPSPDESLVPTEPLTVRTHALLENLLQEGLYNSKTLAGIYRTPRADLPFLRDICKRDGFHMGAVDIPIEAGSAGSNTDTFSNVDIVHSCWVVLGRDEFAVRHLLALQRRKMPGTLEMAEDAWASMGFFRLVLAGLMGGLVVLMGLYAM